MFASNDYLEKTIVIPNIPLDELIDKGFFNVDTHFSPGMFGNKDRRKVESYFVDRFKEELFKELRIEGHPNCETLWRLAWEYGHSEGYNGVLDKAWDLFELL